MSIEKLPDSWLKVDVGNIADVISGGTPKSGVVENFTTSGDGIAWLTPADLSGYKDKYISNGARDLTEKGYSSSSAKLIPAGSILFSSRAPIGYTAIAANKISTNQGFKNFVFTSDIYPSYAYYYFRSIKHLAESMGTGTTFKEISGSSSKKLPFIISPLAEQKIIADKLDDLLARVESIKTRLENIPEILKKFRQSVLSAAVSGRLTEEWRKENNKFFSDWISCNVGEVSTVSTGKTPKRNEPRFWENGSIPWLTSSSTGDINTHIAEQFVTEAALEECNLKLYSPGTLLLAMYGEGKTRGQVTEIKISATCNQACAAIICDETKIITHFLKLRLLENYQEIRKAAVGGNQPNLNLNKVRDIFVLVPSLAEQQEIINRVNHFFDYANFTEKMLGKALSRIYDLTQSILAKAFRGELTAQWREENPELINGLNSAEALLEKITAEKLAAGTLKKRAKKTSH
ncbi:restriction endonuclease subunit S [Klebsiella pneumoniae]|uniref:restriction endonuclease subunit S n=1 Tax=Klebsiella pneumoniae TaxID=573 RepID=UPI000E2CBD2A|nr:restriction endonuclease subunit S [Klebsiella pneumoniae]MEC4463720.1 restriction endonuclease subunit S [Klebsiella pneumoniae]MEC4499660.1 restriction endonuclease subunit S [Klebsiella pneumoniae]SYG64447.1 type I restriction-modification system [Klebsiella pneumoniae]HBV3308461.1 restriction endonuclease subunit S [Klebsiella pneumoniae]HBV3329461.1 restriction endonuclease subunit S [Klebsiella pneumoniae]